MKIYYFSINNLRMKEQYDKAVSLVDKDRVLKAMKYKNSDDRLRCIGAGLIINKIRNDYKIKSDIEISKYGKPYFKDEKIFFNISHSGTYVVAAVSDNEVGIDIQKILPDKHRVAQRNFLDSECEYIERGQTENDRRQRFCEIWTVKEAYLKKIGIGLRKPLNSFEVDLTGAYPRILGKREYRFMQMKLARYYIVAVCVDITDADYEVEEVL